MRWRRRGVPKLRRGFTNAHSPATHNGTRVVASSSALSHLKEERGGEAGKCFDTATFTFSTKTHWPAFVDRLNVGYGLHGFVLRNKQGHAGSIQ